MLTIITGEYFIFLLFLGHLRRNGKVLGIFWERGQE